MELITAIISKKDWKNKIKDMKIQKKWVKELSKLGYSNNVIDKVIKLALIYSDGNDSNYYDDYDDENHFNWILNLCTTMNEIKLGCDDCCKCLACSEYSDNCGENLTDEYFKKLGYDLLDPYDDEHITIVRKHANIKCTCKPALNKDLIKFEYLNQFLFLSKHGFIDENVKLDFVKNVNEFESMTKTDVDWQPGTSNTVLNIIHPSLNCYVDGGDITKLKEEIDRTKLSKPGLFQWIPANFSTKNNKFTSPINNCDMKTNPKLYKSIETIFSQFIPKFQTIFNTLNEKRNEPLITISNDDDDDKELQVIVKIASTRLTPENSKSTATSWHLEGIREEKIIATGIYYYSFENVTNSFLDFRSVISKPWDIPYPQDGSGYVEHHYGMGKVNSANDNYYDNTESTINLGKIETVENMCLIFPNFLQHKVDEFELIDKSKPGHRNILVFFLIDPRERIISTSDILSNNMIKSESKLFRELLMFHRKYEINSQEKYYERGWSLCEH